MWYSGIDQHKRDSVITTYGPDGPPVKQARVPNTALQLERYFAQFPGPHRAVVESTGGWYWLADLLGRHGVDLVLAHATRLTAIAAAKVKTDPLCHCRVPLPDLLLAMPPTARKTNPSIHTPEFMYANPMTTKTTPNTMPISAALFCLSLVDVNVQPPVVSFLDFSLRCLTACKSAAGDSPAGGEVQDISW
ncbi:MAG: hypothetical protein OER90_20970 [Gemmatimonadota bacterium]|nr:hypothetical protein [Gemmatimonadota bacterium]